MGSAAPVRLMAPPARWPAPDQGAADWGGPRCGGHPGAAAAVLPAATRRRRRVGTEKYRFRDDADWEGTCADGRCRCKQYGLDRCVNPFLLCFLWFHCRSGTVEPDRGLSAAALGVVQSPPAALSYRCSISNLRSGPSPAQS